tara:strand:- start:430 stop:582 length:153 start_codon:yes stop_codon:yes gene_type:complete
MLLIHPSCEMLQIGFASADQDDPRANEDDNIPTTPHANTNKPKHRVGQAI